MSQSDTHDSKRRAFLRGGASVGAAAGIVAAAPAIATTHTAPELDTEKQPERQGYRMTKHIAAYYKVAAS